MTTQLDLYNGALLELGERALASLVEDREPRRLLDQVWAAGAVNFCLAAGQWKFAIRTVVLAPDVGVEPSFGYTHAYEQPTDYVRATGLYSDERGRSPLLAYSQESYYWFTDAEPLYVSYVSNGNTYGGDLTRWPVEFVEYVHAYLASKIANKLTQDKGEWERLYKLKKMRLTEAVASDAMEGPTRFLPAGNWTRARRGSGRSDRGNRGSLIG